MAGYRAGVVFVVDTTVSMDPYVARTRETIRTLIEKLHAEEGDKLSLGLVGFRDVLEDGRPDEYIAKVFATLSDGLDPKGFLDRFDAAKVSHADNRDFREDSFAGVKAALDDIDWTGVAGRLIVLITDASPRRANDPYSVHPSRSRPAAAAGPVEGRRGAGHPPEDRGRQGRPCRRRGCLSAAVRLSQCRQPVLPDRRRRPRQPSGR